MDDAKLVKSRGKYTWKTNASEKWAWFEGDRQVTCAYDNPLNADYSFGIYHLEDHEVVETPPKEHSIKDHPEYDRLDRLYGRLDSQQVWDRLTRMQADVKSHQHAGRREFNGRGGRRSSAAVSSEAAREISQEMLLLRAYGLEKFGDRLESEQESANA